MEDVREFVTATTLGWSHEDRAVRERSFDRWLAAHDAEVKAEALRWFADRVAHESAEFPPGMDLTATIIADARSSADLLAGGEQP